MLSQCREGTCPRWTSSKSSPRKDLTQLTRIRRCWASWRLAWETVANSFSFDANSETGSSIRSCFPFHSTSMAASSALDGAPCSNDLYAGVEAIDAKWNDTGKRCHLLGVRKCRFQVQLFGDEFDVAPVTFEIDIFAGERLEQLQARFDGTVPLCPVIDGLSTNQQERPSVGISEVKYLRELFQSVF